MSAHPAPRVLAIASGGGHWVQLLRLRPAFDGCRTTFATVKEGYRADVGSAPFAVVPDSNRSKPLAVLRSAAAIALLVLRLRPHVIVSTGAAPGYLALRLGKLVGARTVWIDSVANAEELSLSGRKARRCADLYLTQWQHLATPSGPRFLGRVF